jgi:hypothetical protein
MLLQLVLLVRRKNLQLKDSIKNRNKQVKEEEEEEEASLIAIRQLLQH